MKVDRDELMQLIRRHFGPELQKAVTFTRWKDGIDVDYSTYAIEAFADAIYEMGYRAGGKYGWQPDSGSVSSDPAPHASRPSVPTGKTGSFNIPATPKT